MYRAAGRAVCTAIRCSARTCTISCACRCRSSTRRSRPRSFAPFSWLGRDPGQPRLDRDDGRRARRRVVHVCFAPLLRRFGRAAPIALVFVVAAVAALSPGRGPPALRPGRHPADGVLRLRLHGRAAALAARRARRHRHRGEARARRSSSPTCGSPAGGARPASRPRRSAPMTLLGFVITPGDSWDFFHSKIFEPTSPEFFTNQSLEGILQRAIGGPWRVVVARRGRRRARVRAARRGRGASRRRRAARGRDHRPGERARLADLVDPPPRVGRFPRSRSSSARAATGARSRSRSWWRRSSSPGSPTSVTTR